MRNFKYLFLFIYLFIVSKAIAQPGNIFGGAPINISQVPWQVSIERNAGGFEHWCGGSIINEEWILSASHCYDGFTGDWMVHAGATNQTQNNVGQRIAIDQIILHPNWSGAVTGGNDLALLHLAQPLCFNANVQPIQLNTSVPAIGANGLITGWGRTQTGGPIQDNLLQATLPIITDANANTRFATNNGCTPPANSVDGTQIALFLQGFAAGPGDSGGPMVVFNNGTPLLAGVSSWGGCPRNNFPTVYADVQALNAFVGNNVILQDLNVLTDLDIITPRSFYRNIIVHSGAKLTITSDVFMGVNTAIVILPGATLEVDGGKITSLCGTNKWAAIANRGTVDLKNNATIENAVWGVVTYNFNSPTTLICNNARFVNNTNGIGIVNGNTTMTIESSTFTGGDYGVYLDRSKIASTFNSSTFSYHTKNGIHAVSSEINVQNNNDFTGCDNGIAVSNLVGSSIFSQIGFENGSSNTFTNNNKGYYGINGDVKIINNVVNNNAFGLYYSGQNRFTSESNTFDGSSYAEGLYSTGTNVNYSNNNIYNSDVGIFPWLRNDRYKFSDNCFSTTWWDVNAPTGSQINVAQGGVNYAASNCFTKNNVPDFICETVNTIIYNVPSNTTVAPACMYPVKPGEGTPSGNYKTLSVFGFDNNGCGGSNFNTPNEYQYIINVGCDSTKLKKIIDSLKVKIAAIKAKKLPLSDTDRWRLYFNERHLVYAMQQKAWCLRKQGKKGQLKDLYTEWAAFFPTESYPRIKSAEVSYDLGNTGQAQSELNALAIATPSKQNAIAAIKLSMDVMTQINSQPIDPSQIISTLPAYTLTPSQYNLLVNVATSSDPDAAYGRALLGYLTGEYLEPYVDYTITPRSRRADAIQEKEVVKYMPNPTSDYLNVVIDKMDEKASYHYDMIDINGRVVLKGQLQAVNQLDASILINGVYILKITKDDLPLERQKIIIQK